VTLDDGAVISYDRLLLAIGASPRLLDAPGADLPNLFYLRTIEDVAQPARSPRSGSAMKPPWRLGSRRRRSHRCRL
jgi:3-phenylpropionate/trans-cinnamate dioxygenase ferredoxin reductase subunit